MSKQLSSPSTPPLCTPTLETARAAFLKDLKIMSYTKNFIKKVFDQFNKKDNRMVVENMREIGDEIYLEELEGILLFQAYEMVGFLTTDNGVCDGLWCDDGDCDTSYGNCDDYNTICFTNVKDYMRESIVSQNVCNYCVNLNLVTSLLNYWKPYLRYIFGSSKSFKVLKNTIIIRLEKALNRLEINPDRCIECEKYANIGLKIVSKIPHQEKIQQIKEIKKYLISPSSNQQRAYFALSGTGGLPTDISRNIIEYLQ